MKIVGGEREKKREILGSPPFRAPPFGAPHFFSGVGPHHDTHTGPNGLAKNGLAKIGQIRMAKTGMAKVGLFQPQTLNPKP